MLYETVIGLEIHAELATQSKIFCGCSTKFGAVPNTQICPICTGMPGTLPMLNQKVVEYAVKAGLALNCSVQTVSKMDRKNYFYPDLPKAYQISQFDLPICTNGFLPIQTEQGKKTIGITRIHIEEDAGKLIHENNETKIDFNRCGVPLIEIVTEPDFRSSAEVKIFLETLKSILDYTEICDCKMQEGSLRCDINISVRPKGQKELGTRTEIKNISSFRSAVKAIAYESSRQIRLLENGKCVRQATMRFDENTAKTVIMRTKEKADDYRFFPEPDLKPIRIDAEQIAKIKEALPKLPHEKQKFYTEAYGLSTYEAWFLTRTKDLANYFESTVETGAAPKAVCNWLMGDISKILREKQYEKPPFKPQALGELIALTKQGVINLTAAKKVLEIMFESNQSPRQIAEANRLIQLQDAEALESIITRVLRENEKAVLDYKNGKEKAFDFLFGQIMCATKGTANPNLVQSTLKNKFNQ